ncbi:MAG: choloylglycine hydrolase [Clostridiales bacterium]|nr:choloylglycine hydrolase [Clostridiales bacterium]
MCTAAKYISGDFYFGRTLDIWCTYGEEVVITPRRRRFSYRDAGCVQAHYAMLGIGCVRDGYPLYYDAVNEKGLVMAGLNFAGYAVYNKPVSCKDNIAQFEFIPWILGGCATVADARRAIARINITDTAFDSQMPTAQLHWIIADRNETIVVECTTSGLNVYDNPVGILTNNPTFPEQLLYLNNYMRLSPKPPVNTFSDKLGLKAYSFGMGALGLPGDLSSPSRFIRAAFTALNSPCCETNEESVSQFFHILGAVAQTKGSCELDDGTFETTVYTSCINATRGILYYTGYDNRQISAVDMNKVNLDGTMIIRYPLIHGEHIFAQN